jgi:23S rRNA (cytidine1920-2'-O)/16S rRNA (cytidine1409-2'-O)-methyltransferase
MRPKSIKVRLDRLLVDRGIAPTRERARALILSGIVMVGEERVDKAGTLVAADAEIRLRGEDHPYVSRGGVKLKSAIDAFGIDVTGLVALDVGASTGGFTDCLLQAGAKKVYAVDVGYGQFAWKLRKDERVVLFEKTNIRFFDGRGIEDAVDIATVDTSFISLRLVLPRVVSLVGEKALILALIKPQFEVGKGEVGKKGVVTDPAMHGKVIEDMAEFCQGLQLEVKGTCESPLLGPAGNKEFFIYLKKQAGNDGD